MKSKGDFRSGQTALLAAVLLSFISTTWAAPQVTNVRATQRAGTKTVDIYYNLSAPAPVRVIVAVSTNGGADFGFPVSSLSGAVGLTVTPGNDRHCLCQHVLYREIGGALQSLELDMSVRHHSFVWL